MKYPPLKIAKDTADDKQYTWLKQILKTSFLEKTTGRGGSANLRTVQWLLSFVITRLKQIRFWFLVSKEIMISVQQVHQDQMF